MIRIFSIDSMTEFFKCSTETPYDSSLDGFDSAWNQVAWGPVSRNIMVEFKKSATKNIQEWTDKRVHLYDILKATSNFDAPALNSCCQIDAHSSLETLDTKTISRSYP